MANVTNQDLAVARVYAEAIIELAQSQGDVDVLLKELKDLSSAVTNNADFKDFVFDPTIGVVARAKTIEKLFRNQYSDLLVDSIQILNEKGRLVLIEALTEAYRIAHEELRGHVQVLVRTSAPLTETSRERLQAVVSTRTGKEAQLVEQIDESLIGGLVVRIADEQFDASVSAKLKTLGSALSQRASREIQRGKSYVEGALT